jgi:hypothetical protein
MYEKKLSLAVYEFVKGRALSETYVSQTVKRVSTVLTDVAGNTQVYQLQYYL